MLFAKKLKKIKRRKKSSAGNLQTLLCPPGVNWLPPFPRARSCGSGSVQALSWSLPLPQAPLLLFLPLWSESVCLGDRPAEPAGLEF